MKDNLFHGKRPLSSYKGEPLLAHPAGFFVMPRKVIELASAPLTEGFVKASIWHCTYEEPGYSDALHHPTKSRYWGQFTNAKNVCPWEGVPPLYSIISASRVAGRDKDYPFGRRTDYGSHAISINASEIKWRQDESKALSHDYYRRDEVVTPAQLALENLRQQLDGGSL
jgi:hypothetical protein